MEALVELVSLCKGSVTVTVNPHKDNYETVEEFLSSYGDGEILDPEILQRIITRDSFVWVQAYPETPIGFYVAFHYDIETAVNQIIRSIKQARRGR